jgi:hypothetical protein
VTWILFAGWNQVVGQREKFDAFLQIVKEEKYPQRHFIGTRKCENRQEMLLSNNVQKFSEKLKLVKSNQLA